ncbi:MAG: prolipoprotein diacylglyceryl transferase [Chloroflexi bacterium]|nr:prolipoprotein diacylglyceryl transferase [Chloroflexota bacterium]
MIEIPFDPEIHLGPISLAWHGIFTAVGIFLGVWLAIRLLRGRVSEDAGYSVATWGVLGGIIGARMLHVADRWDFYSQHLEQVPQIWTGGIAVWGAAIGGVLGGFLVALRRRDVPIGGTADAAAAGIGLGFGVGRIGDIINGEHHALPCEVARICVGYTNPATLGQPGPVHLAIGYEMIWDLLGVGLVLWLLGRFAWRRPEGRIFWTWLVSYALGRWLIGYLRVGDPTPIAGLRQDQVVAVAVLLVAIAALALLQAGILSRAFGRFRRETAT